VRNYRLWPRRAQVGASGYAVLYTSPAGQPRPLRITPAGPAPVARSRSRARTVVRRRRVLTLLFAALAVPTLVALATGSAAAWWVVVALLPVACAYLFVLFRTRRIMAEREINVAFCGRGERTDATLEDLFPAHAQPMGDGLRAVSGGRY